LPQQSIFTHDWDKENKKVRILLLVLIAVLAVVAALVIISVLREHMRHQETTPATLSKGAVATLQSERRLHAQSSRFFSKRLII
jgi:flagellar basal body-associated protein FliL